jgi:ATP-dependent Lon protease
MIFKLNKPKSVLEGNRKEIYPVPLLPLRDIVIFPHMVVPLFIGRERSITALEYAMGQDSYVLLCTQKTPKRTNPAKMIFTALAR